MKREIDIKTERLTALLSAENLGGVLINSQHNFAWLTGGRSNAVNQAAESGACSLFVRRDGKKYILANNIEMPRMLAEEISSADFEPVEFSWQDEKASGNFIFETAKSLLPEPAEIASDLPLNPKFRAIENLIAPCRYSLTAPEIERYRSLGLDAGIVLGEIFSRLEAGETELEIAEKVKAALGAYNIQPMVTLVGADHRISQFRHPVPTPNIWKKILLIAVCARRAGLIVNLSRLACLGDIPGELQRKTEAAAGVCAAVLEQTKTGRTGAELYQVLKNAYAAHGYAGEIMNHHQGGACGYKTRDWVAYPSSTEIVAADQAFAWNPSITGTKIEETVIASNGEIEILTASPGFPAIEAAGTERKFSLPGILQI